MKIKVCGNTNIDQIKELDTLGIDYAGLIFYAQSPRNVLNKVTSKAIREADLILKKVGVFVNANEGTISSMIEEYGLDLVQLHGDETPSFCEHISNKIPVIKVFRINEKNQGNIDWIVKPFEEYVDYYLFDTYSKNSYGGTGEQFNWEALKDNEIKKPFFLSGGIGVDDLKDINQFRHPFFYGIDVNSKVETAPGVKDIELIKIIAKQRDGQLLKTDE